MTKQEMVMLGKMVDALVTKRVEASTASLVREIKTLKGVLLESHNEITDLRDALLLEENSTEYRSHDNGNGPVDPLDEYLDSALGDDIQEQTSTKQQTSKTSPLHSILADTIPLTPEEQGMGASSILDIPTKQLEESNNPGAQMLAKVLNPDKLKKTLKAMEKSSEKMSPALMKRMGN